jgi:transposase
MNNKLLNSMLCKFTVDSEVFHQWVVQQLLPNVPIKSVIIMDNAAFHKRNDTQAVIRDAGHTLLYQPPYSPQLNPIEKRWAYLKNVRKKFHLSVESLFYHFI